MTDPDSVVWITKGREIENYVDPDALHDVLREMHPRVYGGALDTGIYDHAFYFSKKGVKPGQDKIFKDADKVGAADRLFQGAVDFSRLDLRERIDDLAAMIGRANGIAL
ncbi:MAG: hypothetical protein AAFY14_09170 [Pseudomonadota bacterium]